eukprot:3244028-Rhodomonas_salina.1
MRQQMVAISGPEPHTIHILFSRGVWVVMFGPGSSAERASSSGMLLASGSGREEHTRGRTRRRLNPAAPRTAPPACTPSPHPTFRPAPHSVCQRLACSLV